jgi:ribosomal-protein-serine acetyltransferase
MEEADSPVLFELVDRNRAALREWLPWVDLTHSPEDIRKFIARAHEQWNEGFGPQCVIEVQGEIAGCIGCHPIDIGNRNTSLGYWLDADRRGKGIITRATAAMVEYLMGELHLHRVEIRCATENVKSCAVASRLGFTREGVLRGAQLVAGRWLDMVIWAKVAGAPASEESCPGHSH